jgi:hypothetical protein
MWKSLVIAGAAIALFFWIVIPAYQTAAAALETVSATMNGSR